MPVEQVTLGGIMAILLLVLLVLAGLLVGDAIVENTSTTTITIVGQELGGFTLGGWLAVFAVLGFVAAYLLLGMLAAARRNQTRRRALRSSEREMAQRVADLERENSALREHTVDADDLPHREPVAREDTLVDQPSHRPLQRDGDQRPATRVFDEGSGRRATREPAPAAHEHSSVDDYPPSAPDGRRDRWPEPGDQAATTGPRGGRTGSASDPDR
jgi:hypothetical protein